MKYEKILSATILALGIIVMGLCFRSGIISVRDMGRSVSVRGLAERDVPADKVTWTLVYKEVGTDPVAMHDVLDAKNKIVIDFLTSAGVRDSDISVNAPTIVDRQADNYGNEILRYRYKATSTIVVTSTDVALVRKLTMRQGDLMKQGVALVTEDYGETGCVSYEFTGLNSIKPEMIQEATHNARLAAQKFADDSDSKLGKILSAQQGQFSIDDADANTPYIKHVRVVTTLEYQLE